MNVTHVLQERFQLGAPLLAHLVDLENILLEVLLPARHVHQAHSVTRLELAGAVCAQVVLLAPVQELKMRVHASHAQQERLQLRVQPLVPLANLENIPLKVLLHARHVHQAHLVTRRDQVNAIYVQVVLLGLMRELKA